jgi:MFS family permease
MHKNTIKNPTTIMLLEKKLEDESNGGDYGTIPRSSLEVQGDDDYDDATSLMSSPSSSTRKTDDDVAAVAVVEYPASSLAWLWALFLPLQLVYVSNQWSRSSIYYLVNFEQSASNDAFRAMNVAIGFDESQYGLLASLGFTALFAIASIGAGAAADRFNRKTLTIIAATGWSVATLGTSIATTYSEVLTWRILMGLFCAFSTPTAYTLISERVPADRKSLANSLYATGVALGGALASLSILLDNDVGWKQALVVIASAGIASALLCALILPDDDTKKRRDMDESLSTAITTKSDKPSLSFLEDISEAVSTSRARWIFLGSFLRFSSGLCIGVWSAPYFRQAFPGNAGDYAVAQALITAIAGSSSGLIGGAAADYISTNMVSEKGDKAGVRLWVPVVGSLLAAPSWYLAVHSTNDFRLAMTWLTVEYLVAECWFGPTISSLLSTVPSKVGGTAQGLFTLTGAMANFAPTVLGYLYGQASGVEANYELLTLLSTGVIFGYVSSALCFALGAQATPAQPSKGKQN